MSTRRRIVVVMKGYPRLSETFIAQELLALERAGLTLSIVAMRRGTDGTAHPVHAEIAAPVSYLPEYLHQEPGRMLRSLVRAASKPGFGRALKLFWRDLRRDFTRDRFRRFGQGCVLAAEMPADAAWLYAHFIHTPSSVTRYGAAIAGIGWSCSAHAKDIWTQRDWELRDKLASVHWAVTCTGVGAGRLTSLAPDAGRVHLMYHGLDLARFAPRVRAAHNRDGRDREAPVRILSVGRAVEKKGIDALLDALARLPPECHWQFTHIGGGEQLDALKMQAARLGLGSRISWRGALDQPAVLEAYRNSELFVLPCRVAGSGDRDGLPNVLMEAQSQALVCLSTTAGAVSELIVDGETGLLVAPDDVAGLSSAMARLIGDPSLRETLARAGERRVRSRFDAAATIPQLVDLLTASAFGARAVQRKRDVA